MALCIGWQELNVAAGAGLCCSASHRADTTVSAIMCRDNQQKKRIKANVFDMERFSRCKTERTFSAAQTKTAVCGGICNLTLCASQNRIRELFLQKRGKSLLCLCSGRYNVSVI